MLPLPAAATRILEAAACNKAAGIFASKMPAVADDDTDAAANATERYLVSPENIAYLK